jgi:hypothetical protein
VKFRIVTAFLFLALPCFAQSGFWDAERIAETGVYAGSIALDGWATQYGIRQGGFVEENPFARPFISHGVPGQLGASAVGLAAGIGPSYLLYRTGHKRLSRIWLHVFTAGEALNSVQMFFRVTDR